MTALYAKLPHLFPPDDWRPPPPAGHVEAQGWRRHSIDPWRPVSGGGSGGAARPQRAEGRWHCCLRWHRFYGLPAPQPLRAGRLADLPPAPQAGDNDGSTWVRKLTPQELDERDRLTAEMNKRDIEEVGGRMRRRSYELTHPHECMAPCKRTHMARLVRRG